MNLEEFQRNSYQSGPIHFTAIYTNENGRIMWFTKKAKFTVSG